MRRVPNYWLAIGAVCTAVAIGGPAVALANRSGSASEAGSPFQGIGAVTPAVVTPDSPGGSALDVKTASTLRGLNERGQGRTVLGSQLVAKAQTLSATISGKHLYLIPTEKGKLCVFLEDTVEACTEPLSEARPAFVVTADDDGPGGTGPLVFGVAVDGVLRISFAAAGARHDVPVSGNVFAFRGNSMISAAAVSALTATFDDGRTVSLR